MLIYAVILAERDGTQYILDQCLVSFLQDPGALEHTLGNVTLEALLFSLCVSGKS